MRVVTFNRGGHGVTIVDFGGIHNPPFNSDFESTLMNILLNSNF